MLQNVLVTYGGLLTDRQIDYNHMRKNRYRAQSSVLCIELLNVCVISTVAYFGTAGSTAVLNVRPINVHNLDKRIRPLFPLLAVSALASILRSG